MSRRMTCNVLATMFALLIGALTLYVSYTRIKEPQSLLDWAALLLSGATTGTIAYFIVWGHFQKDPAKQTP